VVLKENQTVDPCELRAFLQQTFAAWQVPDAFVVVEALPHTSTGKLMKSKLREQFSEWERDGYSVGPSGAHNLSIRN